jgi:hypothetical protein
MAPQIAAVIAGNSIAQTWTIAGPLSAGGALSQYAHIHTLPGSEPYRYRVVRAGSRKHEVWNPHVNAPVEAKALRYSFEVDNSDGFFHMKTGGCFNIAGIYNADPTECTVTHETYIMVAGQYQRVDAMSFVGSIISVDYVSSANHAGAAVGQTAVITCEQAGAWDALRRTFTKDDGDIDYFVNHPSYPSSWLIVPV